MEFKIEVSTYKGKMVDIQVLNSPSEFCCDMMLDLYNESLYNERHDVSVPLKTYGTYGGIGIVSSYLEPDLGPGVELMFVFEVGRKRERLSYEITFCPFCDEKVTVSETLIPSLTPKNQEQIDRV